MIWSWMVGCAAMLAVSLFRLDERYGISLSLVALLTIWPAIIGWLGFNGALILCHLTLVTLQAKHDKDRPDGYGVILFFGFLATGIVFLGGAIALLYAVLWRVITKT